MLVLALKELVAFVTAFLDLDHKLLNELPKLLNNPEPEPDVEIKLDVEFVFELENGLPPLLRLLVFFFLNRRVFFLNV